MKNFKAKKFIEYTVLFTPDEESGWFVAEVPALPGCVTQGKTLAQAKERIKEAIELYLETFVERNISYPQDQEPNFLKSKVAIKLNKCPA